MRVLLVLSLLLCAAVSATSVNEQRMLAEMEAEMEEKGISIPFYGNWCGPGYPKPGENPKTIDKVDQACKNHDQCYSKKGYFDCGCNTALMKEIPKLPSDCKSDLCKKRYGQIMKIFRNMFCICRNAQASLAGFKWNTKAFTVFNPSKCTATGRFAARRPAAPKKPQPASKKPPASTKKSTGSKKPTSKSASTSSGSLSAAGKKKIEQAIEKAMTAALVKNAAQATCDGLKNFLKPKHAKGKSRMLGDFQKSGKADADYAAKYFSDLLKKKVNSVSPCPIK